VSYRDDVLQPVIKTMDITAGKIPRAIFTAKLFMVHPPKDYALIKSRS
jgi:hypothetical protein